MFVFVFCKQKTAYELRISDWSSDGCSSDLIALQNAIFDECLGLIEARIEAAREAGTLDLGVESINAERLMILDRTVIRRDQTSGAETEILRLETEIGRATCRERVCQYV